MATPTFPLYDQILNGRLEEILRRYRESGVSLRGATQLLSADHGIDVSRGTVATWCDDLGIEKKAAA